MRLKETVTWGIIGAGDVCERKSAPAMYKLPGSIVKSVARRNLDKAEDFARRHNIPCFTNDTDEIFSDPEIDIVYISTPPSSHAELAIRCAEHGKPAYVEKPMAGNLEDCLSMNRSFEKARMPLFVAYYRRTLPNFLKVKEIVEKGMIGEVRSVNILMNKELIPDNVRLLENNWRINPEISGGGYFWDLASHQFDFLDFLFGPIIRANGIAINQAGRYPAEDAVHGYFEFQSGIAGSGSWCFSAGKSASIDKTIITGSNGFIEYSTFGDPTIRLYRDEQDAEIFTFQLPEHIQMNLVQTILDELRGYGKCPSTGESAARTNQVLEWMTKVR